MKLLSVWLLSLSCFIMVAANAQQTDVEKRIAKSLKNIEKRAEKGDMKLQNWLADYYYSKETKQGYEKAVYWWTKAAEQGNAEAQYYLGRSFAYAQGVPEDYATAVCWWKLAAQQGHAEAQSELADCFYMGKGVLKDINTAVHWWQEAAAQGDMIALFSLGNSYEKGEGQDKDMNQAVLCYEKIANASVHTDDPLGQSLDGLYKYLANLRLASIYGLGKDGFKKDVPKACRILEGMIDKYANAQVLLGEIYYQDGTNGTLGSYEKAVKYFTMAREDDSEETSGAAAFFLSKCYRFGRGVPQDVAKADELQRAALEKGWDEAKSLEELLKSLD